MNALLSLEPRVAGDVSLDPNADFPDDQGSLHYAANALPGFCPTEPSTLCTGTITYICEDNTKYCD